MDRRGILAILAAPLALAAASRRSAAAEPKTSGTHRLVLHVDRNDAAVMNMALGNAANAAAHYAKAGESIALELVAYGPGLHMLRADTSPVKEHLAAIHARLPQMVFSGCNNTKTAMEKAEGKPVVLLPEARLVPAGIVRLVELQEQGWSYVKP